METVVERLRNLPEGHCIDLRSYKRNRSLLFIMNNNEEILIIEDGYEKKKHIVSLGNVRKKLKSLIKREFPRSRKLRLYNLGPFDESVENRNMKKL